MENKQKQNKKTGMTARGLDSFKHSEHTTAEAG